MKKYHYNFSDEQQSYLINADLSISFSSILKKGVSEDIYNGTESIPFEKRNLIYKNIFRKEFSNAIKELGAK